MMRFTAMLFGLALLVVTTGCGGDTPASVKVDKDLIDKQNAAQKQADTEEKAMQKQQQGKK